MSSLEPKTCWAIYFGRGGVKRYDGVFGQDDRSDVLFVGSVLGNVLDFGLEGNALRSQVKIFDLHYQGPAYEVASSRL